MRPTDWGPGPLTGCVTDCGFSTEHRFEPWGLMYRPALGFFDVRYRGYGRNKIQHLYMHLQQMGWR